MIGAFFVFHDRPGRLALIGLIVAFAGVCCVGSGDMGVSRDSFFGDTLSFLSTLAIAVNMLIAKRILTRVPSYLYSLCAFAAAFLFFAVYNLTTGTSFTGYPPKEWLLFALLAILPTLLGHMIFNWLLAYVNPTTISMTVLAEPVGASLLGVILFREMLGVFQIVGGILVIAGLLMYLKPQNHAESVPAGHPAS